MAVVNVETTRSEPFAGGRSFGRAGPYRRTDGVVTFGVDPDNRANGAIVDLGLAPRDTAGRVLFRSDFALIAPEESDRGNRGLIVDVVNRGRRYGMSSMFNLGDAPPEGSGEIPVGDGFLYRNGYSTVSIGWQWDVYRSEGLIGLEAPRAQIDGKPVRGQTVVQMWPNSLQRTWLLADRVHHPYPVADMENPEAALFVRDWEDGPDTEIPAIGVEIRERDGRRRRPQPGARLPRVGFPARPDLPPRLHHRGGARGRRRTARRAGGRNVAETPVAAEPGRWRTRPRLRVRLVADGPAAETLRLSRPEPGRGRQAGLRRAHAARGRREARRVQPPVRPAVGPVDAGIRAPVPVRGQRDDRRAHRPALRSAEPSGRAGRRAERSSIRTRRPSTGAAMAPWCTSTGSRGATWTRRSRRGSTTSGARSTVRARCRRAEFNATDGCQGPPRVQRRRLPAAPSRGPRQPRPVGCGRRGAAAEQPSPARRRHRRHPRRGVGVLWPGTGRGQAGPGEAVGAP